MKKNKKKIIWILAIVLIIILLGIGIFYLTKEKESNSSIQKEPKTEETTVESQKEETTKSTTPKDSRNKKKEPTQQQQVKALTQKLQNQPKLLAAAVAWYGSTKDSSWQPWKEQNARIYTSDLTSDANITKEGDGIYHQYDEKDRQHFTQGYLISRNKKDIYLYSRLSVGSKEMPFATISFQQLAQDIIAHKKLEEIQKLAQQMQLTQRQNNTHDYDQEERETFNKVNESIASYLPEWAERIHQEYEKNNLLYNSYSIPLGSVTLVNDVEKPGEARVAVDGSFIKIDTKDYNQGYRIFASYSGINGNCNGYQYLFAETPDEPIVLFADLNKDMTTINGIPTLNFSRTKNGELDAAYGQLCMGATETIKNNEEE